LPARAGWRAGAAFLFQVRLVHEFWARILPSDPDAYSDAFYFGFLVEGIKQPAILKPEAAMPRLVLCCWRLLPLSRATRSAVLWRGHVRRIAR
jgi:hypothetical protein